MTFVEATDRLLGLGLTIAEIAEALGSSRSSVSQARLSESNDAYRTPPPGWQGKLRELARDRGGRFHNLERDLAGAQAE